MSYKFVQNKKCEYFPCHEGIKEVAFNCLLCYCPLYCMKDQCGGNYEYTSKGIKSCSRCNIPHVSTEGYDQVMGKIGLVIEKGKIKLVE